ncbi:methyltransferase domain-containing protein [Pararhizobium haloflavum]|uniref:methyltransferase domain-containing protein n=1 Tax=Pararhizobium haloflavum TaxID=2037914 RepID=UPI0018E48F4D|nr:methyltransferase domain-containing protein [Pararhizobium haloflavum]
MTDRDDQDHSGQSKGMDIDAMLAEIRAEAAELERRNARPQDGSGAAVDHRAFQQGIHIPGVADTDGAKLLPIGDRAYGLMDFQRLSDTQFIQAAYHLILRREPDQTGHQTLTDALRAGTATRAQVLSGLMRSQEAEKRPVEIAGVKKRRLLDIAGRVPVIGRLLAPLVSLVTLRSDMLALRQRLSAMDERHGHLVDQANETISAIRRTLRDFDMHVDRSLAGVDRAMREHEVALGKTEEKSEKALSLIADATATSSNAASAARAAQTMLVDRSQHLSRLIEEARRALPETSTPARQTVEVLDEHKLDELYLAFENRFRGSREEITARVRRYIPAMKTLPPAMDGLPVLDIGCGRGEWLSELRDAGVAVQGADLNVAMVEEARAKGHTVHLGDAIALLKETPDASLAGVTGFHIIEHISYDQLITLFDEARRALAPGGAILFETPNPECLTVGAYTFYFDPTHRNPLPPALTQFLAEARGFERARIIRYDDDLDLEREPRGFDPKEINDWFQVPLDYAVLAFKS